ncbi:hypothetical protein V8C42DRAFT_300130 [Trichoderma barbatum]
MIFPIFNMPCLHNHHEPPHILYSRDAHDGEISVSAAIGLTVGLTLVALVVVALVYFCCWRQQDRHKQHRRQNSESRHRREKPADHVTIANGDGAAEKEKTTQKQDRGAQTEQESPLPKMPLSIHHHQHDSKYFHGDHYHDHIPENDHIVDRREHNDGQEPHGSSHLDRHGHQRRHHHHHFHRTHQILLPRDSITEFEKLITPLSPGIPNAARAELEAILNGLDIPLPNEPAHTNSRTDANVNEQGTACHEEEPREKKKKRHHHRHHRHHCHHRHKRLVVH